jgi:hypothetical protein
MKPFHRDPEYRPGASSWAAELVELAAVFFAVGVGHLFVSVMGEYADTATMLMFSGAALAGGAVLHRWWGSHRRRHTARRVGPERPATLPDLLSLPAGDRDLMRLRTTLPDRPGTLATLAGQLAGHDINILAIQIHPCMRGAVDELLIAVPRSLTAEQVTAAVAAGGGESTQASPADLHDLVDPATRALTLAAHATQGRTHLREALLSLLSADIVSHDLPAGTATTAQLRGPAGEPVFLGRRSPAFTPTELSRAQAMIDLYVRAGDPATRPRR